MRNIPAALKAHIDSGVTTLCRLLKIRLEDGREFGMTTLDRDVEYQGLSYKAMNGFDTSIISTDESFSVDNAEGYSLFAADVPGIEADMVYRGELDNATWEMMIVNYSDLSQGHILLDRGDVGEVKAVRDTVFIPELLSFTARLRQTIGLVDSRTCRARFGSPANSQTGCGVDVAALWESHTVTAEAAEEPNVTFFSNTVSGITPPARVQWTGGDNASTRLYQVEVIDESTGQITLLEPLPLPVKINDTFDIRPDCDKRFETCRDTYDNMLNFKGENLIPTGEAVDTPGVGVPGSGGGGFVGGDGSGETQQQ